MILDPVKLAEDAVVGDALKLMAEFKIGRIPVVDGKGRLVGIVTNRDLRFEKKMSRPVAEVMTRDGLITAAPNTTMAQAEAAGIPAPLLERLADELETCLGAMGSSAAAPPPGGGR